MGGSRPRCRVAALVAALLFPPGSVAGECPPVEIRVTPSYEAPRGFAFAPVEELSTKSGSSREPLGVIESAVGWDVEVGVRQRCLGATCELCVSRIEGTAGFEPGRILVASVLRGDRCRTDAVVEHETRHSRAFDESTRHGVARLVDILARWARRQNVLVARPEAVEAAAKKRFVEIERLMRKGVAWIEQRARAQNERIDSPEAYEAERERIERRCGKDICAQPGGRRGGARAAALRRPAGPASKPGGARGAGDGWGTRIRTWAGGVRVRSPTARRSPREL